MHEKMIIVLVLKIVTIFSENGHFLQKSVLNRQNSDHNVDSYYTKTSTYGSLKLIN
jgi:hypothetical protein